MKKLFTLLFILITFSAYGQSKATKNIIEQLSTIKTLSADFQQVNDLKDYGEDVYSGKILINMKDKALWDYITPYSSWYYITSEDIDHYDEINNQLVKRKAKNYKEYALLQVLMDFSKISENFNADYKRGVLYLIPKNDVGLEYVHITFKNNIISEINSKDNNGNLTKITLSNVALNEKIDDKSFKKDLPKDVNIFQQ